MEQMRRNVPSKEKEKEKGLKERCLPAACMRAGMGAFTPETVLNLPATNPQVMNVIQ